jgi:hypothetical protein
MFNVLVNGTDEARTYVGFKSHPGNVEKDFVHVQKFSTFPGLAPPALDQRFAVSIMMMCLYCTYEDRHFSENHLNAHVLEDRLLDHKKLTCVLCNRHHVWL